MNSRETGRRYDSPLRQAQVRDTRERILEALVRVLARGVTSLSIPAVAREAGVSVPTVYRYFKTKEELVAALDGHLDNRLGLAEARHPTNPEELAEAAADAFRKVSTPDLTLRAALSSELGRRARFTDRAKLVDVALAPIAGDLDPEDHRRLRSVLTLLCTSQTAYFLQDHLGHSPDEAAEIAAWAIRTLTRAVQHGQHGQHHDDTGNGTDDTRGEH